MSTGRVTFLTYLAGRNGETWIQDLVPDADGSVVVLGQYTPVAGLADFPITGGPVTSGIFGSLPPLNGGVFIAKLAENGSRLSYSVFISRGGQPDALIVQDGFASATYYAEDAAAPVLARPLPGTGSGPLYLAKITRNGSGFVFATSLAQPGSRVSGATIAAGPTGQILVSGVCEWGACLPMLHAHEPGDHERSFLVAISPDGQSVQGMKLASGTHARRMVSVAADGSVLLVAAPSKTGSGLSGTSGAWQVNPRTMAGSGSPSGIFLSKVDLAAARVIFSTWFGGGGSDDVHFASVDGDGSILLAGISDSPDLPVTPDARALCSRWGGFAAKLTPDGRSLRYASYLEETEPSTVFGRSGDFLLLSTNGLLSRTPLQPAAGPGIRCVANHASGLATEAAPGLVVRIRGSGLGPSAGEVRATALPLPFQLAGVEVAFDRMPGGLLAVSDTEIIAVIPEAPLVGDPVDVRMTIRRDGQPIAERIMPYRRFTPAVFTLPDSAFIAAAIDNAGRIVTIQNPAVPGTIISFFGTGLSLPGQFDVVEVSFQRVAADVLYAGPAPGLMPGIFQVNVRVPVTGVNGLFPVFLGVRNRGPATQRLVPVSCAEASGDCRMSPWR